MSETRLAAAMERNAEFKRGDIRLDFLDHPLTILVEGPGDWAAIAYRPAFHELRTEHHDRLYVFYADDARWKPPPSWTGELKEWEVYLNKAEPRDYEIYSDLRPDVVVIVTPDLTHSAIAQHWCGRCQLVLIEKPFDTQSEQVERLFAELGRDRRTAVAGLDHYLSYALPVFELRHQIAAHLGGSLRAVEFFMTEDRRIELGRERTLQFGLTLDLLPHLLALLTYFGDVATIDDIRVPFAGQYRPLEAEARDPDVDGKKARKSISFRSETAAAIGFTFEDYSGNGHLVRCRAVVGKGFSQEVKYCELIGRNGQSIRIDFCRPRQQYGAAGYPWSQLFFIAGSGPTAPTTEIADAYDESRRLSIAASLSRPIERDRYKRLFLELMNGPPAGGSVAVASTLSRDEARAIVKALDRIWWAVHRRGSEPGGWQEYAVGQLDPMQIQERKR
jgi:predicted dehydrogenase